MPSLPSQFLNSLNSIDLPDKEGFIRIHESGEQLTSIRCNPFKSFDTSFELGDQIPWTSRAYYLKNRPSFTFDPAFHAGCYYVQEAGSMFLEHALTKNIDFSENLKVLDLCAAPGGKSTIVNSLISDQSLLVSNEMIQNRSQTLAYNLSKWGRANSIVTNNNPEQFENLPGFFDLLVVDAPCSGSGLFRKQPEAIEEWSPEHVNSCSMRQKHILNSALLCLKENGYLFYSTCSYSRQENEDIVEWLETEHGMEVMDLAPEKTWGVLQNEKGCRFYPHLTRTEGFFCSLLVKKKSTAELGNRIKIKNTVTESEKRILMHYANNEGLELYRKNEKFYLLNKFCLSFLHLPVQGFYFRKAGVCLGELKNLDLVPEQELALSLYLSKTLQKAELNKELALAYLRKENFVLSEAPKGLLCFTYQNHGIGWGKVLANRINNYLPQNLRILKEFKP